jgi:hypothetical protein
VDLGCIVVAQGVHKWLVRLNTVVDVSIKKRGTCAAEERCLLGCIHGGNNGEYLHHKTINRAADGKMDFFQTIPYVRVANFRSL